MASEWKGHRSVIELLDRFYCWKSTLREYFEFVFFIHNVNERSRSEIFKDENNRLDYVLDGTIICCGCDVDVIPRALKLFDSFCYQQDLVRRVVETKCQSRTQMENVISRGFSLCKHDSARERLFGSNGIQIDHPNTMTSYMCSEIWGDLCSRVGSDLMLHILQNMSMFHKMSRSNLLQVTGTVFDKSKMLSDNHKCNGHFLALLQQLSRLNPEMLTITKQGSPHMNRQAAASVDCPSDGVAQERDNFTALELLEVGTTLNRRLLDMLSGYKCIEKESFSQANTASGLESDKLWKRDCTKLSRVTDINPPLHFGAGDNVKDENGNDYLLGEGTKTSSISINERKRQYKQISGLKASEGKLMCCNRGAKICRDSLPDEKKEENKELGKKHISVLNRIYRKKTKIKFKPLGSQINEETAFRMRRIMYGSHLGEGLHRSHILDSVDCSNKGARALAFDVFCSGPGENKNSVQASSSSSQSQQNPTAMKLPRNLQRSLPLFRQLIDNYKKLKVHKLLQRHCPSSIEVSDLLNAYRMHRKKLVKNPSLKFDADSQMKLYVAAFNDSIPPYKVFLFVRSICRKVLPNELLQLKSNWTAFYKNLRRFFTLGKHEFISLQMIMKGIKPSHCTWTYKSQKRPTHVPRSFSSWQQKTIESFIRWVVVKLVIPLLKSCFYVTESGQHRKRVFYFRRKSWSAIECLARDTCFNRNFIEVKREVVDEAMSKGDIFGCGKMRVVPKANKLRPIINMKYGRGKNDQPVSINIQAERLLHVLKFSANDQPHLLGAAVLDMDEINTKLKHFRKTIDEIGESGSTMYFVASDIECCFDSIPHCKLFEVVKSAIEKSDYLIRKFSTTSYVMFKECLTVTKRVATRDTAAFPAFIEKYLNSKDCTISNSIIADGVFYAKEKKDFLCNSLWRHITQSYVQFGSRYYRLERGIAQGSVLSTYLCNMLYGNLERTHLSEFMNTNECILMRWTDDFLLISTSKHLAEKFFEKLKVGFPEYGCSINIEKSKTNLPDYAPMQANGVQLINASWFPWCNLLINMDTLEVRFSYDRFIGKSVGDAVSLRLESRPGRRLICRMMQHARIQTTAIVFDPALNSRENILTNAYQIFSFVAIKLNHHIINLPTDGQPNFNPKFFYLAIHCIFRAFYRQYRRVHGKVCSNRVPLISKNDMKGLYYVAILNVLNKHKTRYIKLIKLIRPNAKKYRSMKTDYAKIEAESAVFDKIR